MSFVATCEIVNIPTVSRPPYIDYADYQFFSKSWNQSQSGIIYPMRIFYIHLKENSLSQPKIAFFSPLCPKIGNALQ